MEVENELGKETKIGSEQAWEPTGDTYYALSSSGEIVSELWSADYWDCRAVAIGNCFRTKEDAVFAKEKLMVIAELKYYAEPKECRRCPNVPHWRIYYDTDIEKVLYTHDRNCIVGDFSFSSLDAAKRAVDAVGEDRVKYYYFGVK